MMKKFLVSLACLAVSGTASALSLFLTHAYGELVDRGNVTVHASSGAWDCSSPVSVVQAGNQITVTGAAAPGGPLVNCLAPLTAMLQPLKAGRYDVTARLVAANGAVVESATQAFEILPLEGRCNPDPTLSPSIMSKPKGNAAEFVARVKADPALAASLGNPAVRLVDFQAFDDEVYFDYPPLDDIPPAMDRLANTGLFEWLAPNGRACFSAAPPDRIATVLEFYHAGLDHYFYTASAQEIANIDAGKVGPWARTGRTFRVNEQPGCEDSSPDTVVYRFYGVPGKGPNSHFFTRDRAECYAVDKSRQWALEGVPFHAAAPLADGTCRINTNTIPPQTRVPLHRLWRPFGDSNHRFTTDRAIVKEMVAKGWIDEGVAMCVQPST
jgi:hypothetical protein